MSWCGTASRTPNAAESRRTFAAVQQLVASCLFLTATLYLGCAATAKKESQTPSRAIVAQTISGELADLGSAHPKRYSAIQPLPLAQYWKGPSARPTESGVAYIGVSPGGLSLYAYLEDSDIFSDATADGQPMPALGDVVEFFVKPGVERSDYWEVHVTPNDFLLDIHISDRAEISKGGGITWEQVMPFTAASSSATRRVGMQEGSWAVELAIPWGAFGLEGSPKAGVVWQFAICRFNYTGSLENPELSSTAPITELNFHRFEEHHDLVF